MRKVKHVLAVSLALIVAICAAGCGKKEEESGYPKLKYYVFGSTTTVGQGLPAVQEAMNVILREKIGAEIEISIIEPGQYGQKMPVIMGSGEKFDLMFTSNWLNNFANNVSKGALLEIDELIKEYGQELYDSIPEEIWNAARINGKLYGVPNYQIVARQAALVFRKDIVDKVGFDINSVNDLADLDELFRKADEAGVNEKGEFDYQTFGFASDVFQAMGWEYLGGENVPGAIDATNPDHVKVFNQFASDEFKNYADTMNKWYKRGYYSADKLTSSTSSNKPYFVMDMGCYTPGSWDNATRGYFGDYEGELVVRPYGETIVSSANVLATMTGISRTSENPELAMKYLNLINTDKELYNLICFGIEGRDYKKVSENRIEKLPGAEYWPNSDWAFGNQFNAYYVGAVDDGAWEEQKKMNETATKSPLLGFNFDQTSVQTEVANCSAVVTEYLTLAKNGLLEIGGNYKEFMSKLEKAGSNKIIEEMQRQVDLFIQSK